MNSESLIVYAPLALLVLAVGVRRVRWAVRAKRMKGIAAARGSVYHARLTDQVEMDYDYTFMPGNPRSRTRNFIHVQDAPIPFLVFDYAYANRKPGRIRRTIALVQSYQFILPDFHLAPTTWRDRVNHTLGFRDINFDQHPEFSERYQLSGEDEEAIRAVFTPVVLAYFARQHDWHLRATTGQLNLHRGRKFVPISRYETYLQGVREISGLLVNADAGIDTPNSDLPLQQQEV